MKTVQPIDRAKYEGHAPGPWQEGGSNDSGRAILAPDGENEPWIVARVVGFCGYVSEYSEPNAALIIDAPLLLDKCDEYEAAIAERDAEIEHLTLQMFVSVEQSKGKDARIEELEAVLGDVRDDATPIPDKASVYLPKITMWQVEQALANT